MWCFARRSDIFFESGKKFVFSKRFAAHTSRMRRKIPLPPEFLNEVARREWQRITREMHREGLVTHLDTATIGAYCMVYSRIVEAETAIAAEGTVITTASGRRCANPWCGILNTNLRQLSALSGQLGLSPSARKHVQLTEEKLQERFENGFG